MSNEQQGQTLSDVLIERQSMRLGQMATQIEALTIQLEHAINLLSENGINIDGTSRKEDANDVIRSSNGEEVAIV